MNCGRLENKRNLFPLASEGRISHFSQRAVIWAILMGLSRTGGIEIRTVTLLA
jgi:hypothetical protein